MLLFVAAKYCIAKATYTNWLVPQHSKTMLCINFNSNSMLICWDDSFCLDHVCQTNVVCYWFFYHLWSLVVGDNLKIESPPVWKKCFSVLNMMTQHYCTTATYLTIFILLVFGVQALLRLYWVPKWTGSVRWKYCK